MNSERLEEVFQLSAAFIHALVVIDYRPFWQTILRLPWKWESPFVRVHQKILSVDGKVTFCGGMNISKGKPYRFQGLTRIDYADPSVGGTGRFKDIHCRVEGPAVQSLEKAFIRTLQKCCTGDMPLISELTIVRLGKTH